MKSQKPTITFHCVTFTSPADRDRRYRLYAESVIIVIAHTRIRALIPSPSFRKRLIDRRTTTKPVRRPEPGEPFEVTPFSLSSGVWVLTRSLTHFAGRFNNNICCSAVNDPHLLIRSIQRRLSPNLISRASIHQHPAGL